ncbi:hypothetical protein G3I19_31500, partial [Streptomyces sp. SID10853]|uniref:acetyl-CoA carboxylase biotin carboxyl carrier protein subunit n=1 Tax=Streptomyces sp. SID10853 TaxID=2706028 RepID=UPI0013C25181|nr:hypothetical protein [Streptomyces sp. SID10853]
GGAALPVRQWLQVPGRKAVQAEGAGRVTPDTVSVTVGGTVHTFHRAGDWLGRDGDAWHVQDHDPVQTTLDAAAGRGGAGSLTAPMPGTVTVVKVATGDEVSAGQGLLVVEAMKMEHLITAPHAGTVTELDVVPGTTVAMDQVLAVVTPAGAPADTAADGPAGLPADARADVPAELLAGAAAGGPGGTPATIPGTPGTPGTPQEDS